jgi:hypothetical protein
MLPISLANRVQFDEAASELILTDLPTAGEVRLLRDAMADERDRQAVDDYWERERPGGFTVRPLTEVARPLVVPKLAVRIDGRLSLLEPIELDQFQWDLNGCDAAIGEREFSADILVGSAATIDIEADSEGRTAALVSRSAGDVRLRQLELIGATSEDANPVDRRIKIDRFQSSYWGRAQCRADLSARPRQRIHFVNVVQTAQGIQLAGRRPHVDA